MDAKKRTTQLDLDLEKQVTGFRIPKNHWVINWIERKLLEKGWNPKRARTFARISVGSFNRCPLPERDKFWALKNGFYPTRIPLYGLTKDNYQDYVSDAEIDSLHPLNNHFAFWINDKLTLKYLLSHPLCIDSDANTFYDVMPEYYLYIENDGHYSYLMNNPRDIPKDKDYLLHLLESKQRLAMKPNNGAGGYGFVGLQYKNGQILWNEEVIDKDVFDERIKDLNGYIVTEYVAQHHMFDEVWTKSVSTLRIVACKELSDNYDGGKIHVISSYLRFGTEMSDGACNMHNGGVAVAYDFNTGDFGDFFFQYPGFSMETRHPSHPDTKVSLKGKKLPHWELVKKIVLTACEYLSSLEYFGVDVVVTEEGAKILEINCLPAVSTPQVVTGPYMKDPAAREFFRRKLHKKYDI